jgi:hypothetical protein
VNGTVGLDEKPNPAERMRDPLRMEKTNESRLPIERNEKETLPNVTALCAK